MLKQLSSKTALGGLAFLAFGAFVAVTMLSGNKLSRAESKAEVPAEGPVRADLPDWGPAPDIKDKIWLHSDPLHLADLRGKVVLVNFWTQM